jgi:cellulose synthase (UDP-forming)
MQANRVSGSEVVPFPDQDSVRPMSERTGVWLLRGLVVLGIIALIYYFSWWRVPGRIISPWLTLALVLATIYNWTQLAGNWLLYLAARRRPAPPPPPKGLTIDVFVTAYNEPYALIERSLAAACAMRGDHRTWLLDDGADPALASLAKRLGAGYLMRTDRTDAKAGNVNAALSRTTGDVVVIFDVDHVPAPDFLERTVGYFADPTIGFVQVMLTFYNNRASWVARAAAESSLDFYNPTSMGADGIESATLIGSNVLIRRTALASIGGYRPGLAEDLATSIALHAAGWRSVYVAEPLAPGLAPPDVPAWFRQQLKWARGVFELLLTQYPRFFGRLTWGQRLSYAVRMTYYWIGAAISVHLLFTIAMLIGGSSVARVDFQQYLVHVFPLALITLLTRQVALHIWRHPSTPTTLLWRAMALVYATWPIYTLTWVMALLRLPLTFRPTPKGPTGDLNPLWLLPQVVALLLIGGAILHAFVVAGEGPPPLLFFVAGLQGIPQMLLSVLAVAELICPTE